MPEIALSFEEFNVFLQILKEIPNKIDESGIRSVFGEGYEDFLDFEHTLFRMLDERESNPSTPVGLRTEPPVVVRDAYPHFVIEIDQDRCGRLRTLLQTVISRLDDTDMFCRTGYSRDEVLSVVAALDAVG